VTDFVLTRPKLLPTYARQDVTFVDGDGAWLVDGDGNRYLDCFAGIAVVGLGHRHPAPLAAAHAQLDRLWHVSNLYFTEPMQELSRKLSQRFGGASAFFCNSGAESIEAALKWAFKATGRHEIVALDGSFHGRTLGALSVTGQPAKRAAFEPLVPGAKFGLEHVSGETAAILLEPVQ
jgi:acetylornithine/N-succinyldiaminopimelate aminotransferase